MEALKKYLADAGVKKSQFAKDVGVSPGRISQILNDPDQRPSRELIAKIEKATGGKVTFQDWVEAPEEAA